MGGFGQLLRSTWIHATLATSPRGYMAWALHAVARGLCREQIEHEILNSRDLSKKGPPLRRLAYAMRTARKAISLSAE
jgi:hypothetical protein